MAKVNNNLGKGEMGGSGDDIKTLLNEMVDDLTELRTQIISLLQKLDSDTGTTDSDYESSLTPAALNTTKSDY